MKFHKLPYFSTSPFFLVFAVLVLLALAAAPPSRADFSAVNKGVTLDWNTTNLTVTEGDSLTIDFTLINNSGSSISGNAFPFILSPLGPDITDVITAASTDFGAPGSCFGTLADGGSCTFSLTLFTDPATGETDADFGQQNVDIDITGNISGPPQDQFIVSLTNTVTVTDPATGVPEPSSSVLLLAGLLLIGPVIRQRLVRS